MGYAPPLPGTQQSGVLTAPGSVQTQPGSGDTAIEIEIFPTPSASAYTGVTLYFEESLDSGASWLPRAMVDLNTQNIVATNSGLSVSDGSTHGWQTSVSSTGTTQFRVRVSAISGGSASFNLRTWPMPGTPFASAVAAGGSGGPGSFSTMTLTGALSLNYANALSANSGGVQAAATPITGDVNTFTTVGGAGYSGLLPAAAPGRDVTVINEGANYLAIFPAGTDAINGLGASNAINLAAGKKLQFISTATGQWWALGGVGPATEIVTTLATNGAGSLTAAALVGGVVLRTTVATAFTDTTVSAATIANAMANPNTAASWEFTYLNNTDATATLAGGSNVTFPSAGTIVGAGCWARYLVTYVSATSVTIVPIAAGTNYGAIPAFAVTTSAATATATFAANILTGAQFIVAGVASLAGSATLTTRTPAQMLADFANSFVGMTWTVRIANTGAAHTLTIGAGSGWTLSGGSTYAVSTGSYMDFQFTFTSATAGTMVGIASGTNMT